MCQVNLIRKCNEGASVYRDKEHTEDVTKEIQDPRNGVIERVVEQVPQVEGTLSSVGQDNALQREKKSCNSPSRLHPTGETVSNSAGVSSRDLKTGETGLRCNHCSYETRRLKRSKAKQMRDHLKGCKGDKAELGVVQEDTEPGDMEQPKRLEAAVPSPVGCVENTKISLNKFISWNLAVLGINKIIKKN